MASQRYILDNVNSGELILVNAPAGWNDLKYTISRSKSYHGLMRSFSGTLKFVKDGKDYIDNILTLYGFESLITIKIQELNQLTRIWETKVSGILNFDPKVYVKERDFTEINFEDSSVHKKMKNRESSEIAYNRKETLSGVVLPGFADETQTVVLRGQSTDEANAIAVFPWQVFNRIFQVACDLDYNPLISSVFGKTEYGYVEDGIAANVMLSNGLLMRGSNIAGDEVASGYTNLNFTLKDLFTNFDNLFNLGLDIIYDETNERYNFVIEEKGYFYQTYELFTIESLSNLKYSYEPDLIIQKITTGYRKFTKENDIGLSEYNNSLEFITPVSVSDTELNIESTYRADGIGFQLAIDNRLTASDEVVETDIDKDNFFIHVFDDEGTLKSVQDEDFDLIGGLYGSDPIQANVYISPARNMKRWGPYIGSGLSFFSETGKLRFNKAENLSDLRSQYVTETDTIYENRDFNISDLGTPRFSGRKIDFEAPLTRDQINTISGNPYGLVKFWDYIAKEYNYGWIVEASTDRVDRDTTWELWEAANLVDIDNNMEFVDGVNLEFVDGENMIFVAA